MSEQCLLQGRGAARRNATLQKLYHEELNVVGSHMPRACRHYVVKDTRIGEQAATGPAR